MVRLDRKAAHDRAVALAVDPGTPAGVRLALLHCLGELGRPDCADPVLRLLGGGEPEVVRVAALEALQRFDREEVGTALLRLYPRLNGRLRSRACDVLLSRKRWARAFLGEIDRGRLPAGEVTPERLRQAVLHRDEVIDALVCKHWGTVRPPTPEEKLAEMRRLNNDLRAARGDPATGWVLFRKLCAGCHRLFGEGTEVGPDLTHANRKDRDYLLAAIVDPGAVVRKEYVSYTVRTRDGRVVTGLIADEAPGRVTLVAGNNERTTIPRDRIEAVERSPVSLMPEDLLKGLRPQELRDLFSYLEGDQSPDAGRPPGKRE
jgi:putative heme-binding domain-containing protein